MRRKERGEQSGLNDMELKRNTQVLEEAMAALNQMEERLKASSTRLNEILDEVRAETTSHFSSSSTGCHRREICQDEADEAKAVVCAIRT